MMRRLTHIGIDLVLVGGLAVAALAGIAAWRLSDGPVSLGFAKPYIDQALAEIESPYRIGVREVVLTWGGWRRPFEILAIEPSVRDSGGKVLAIVPEASVSLAFRALLTGRLAPSRLDLIGPDVTVIRNVDGSVVLGLSGPDGSMLALDPGDLMSSRDGPSPWTALRLIEIHRASLRLDDRKLGLEAIAPSATVSITRNEDGLQARFDLKARIGEARAALSGTVRRDRAGGAIDIVAELAGVRPDRFAAALERAIPAVANLGGVALPLTGSVRARIDAKGGLEAARFEITGGSGSVTHPGLGTHRYDVHAMSAAGSYEVAGGHLIVDRMEIDIGGPRLSLDGSFAGISDTEIDAIASGHASLQGLSLQTLPQYWPEGVAKGARAWISENLDRGVVEDLKAEFAFRLPAGAAGPNLERAKVTLGLSGARIHYLRPLGPIVDIDASVEIDRDRVMISIERGILKELTVDSGTVAITDLSAAMPQISVDVALRGPVRSALAVIDHPRFGYASRLGLAPARVAGQAAIRISAKFPAIATLGFSDVEIGATAQLEGLSAPGAFLGRDLAAGSFSSRIDGRGMLVSGKASIAGIATDIDWSERFDGSGPFRRRYDLRARISEADRKRLGFDLTPVLAGPVRLTASYRVASDGERSASGKIDLGEAVLEIAELDWRKAAGDKADAAFAVEFAGERVRAILLDRITAGDLIAGGRVVPNDAGSGIKLVDIERFEIGKRIDVSGRLARDGSKGWSITAIGRRFDASSLMRRADGPVADAVPPIRLDATIGSLVLRPGHRLDTARVTLRRDTDRWRKILLKGRFPTGKALEIDYDSGPIGRRLAIKSGDAGRTLKLFGILDRIRGGSITLSAERPIQHSGKPWLGRLLVKGFVLANVPQLANALSLASFGTLSKSLDGAGIRFHRLDLPFSYRDSRIEINNGRALGRELGLTGRGAIDLAGNSIDFDGTLIPAYTINSLLGSIPIVGRLFSGEKGGGLFAATFSVAGPLDKPKVALNPLAVLAPGFLRNLILGNKINGDVPLIEEDLRD